MKTTKQPTTEEIIRKLDPHLPKHAVLVSRGIIASATGNSYEYYIDTKDSSRKYFIGADKSVYILGAGGYLIPLNDRG